jgi:preprotein translocase subunit YajC
VHAVLFSLLEWFQPEATGGGGGGGAGDGGGGGGDAVGGALGCEGNMGLLLVMMLIFYFMLIRPQQKRQKETDSMLKALRKGVKVRTTGGILGEIFSIDEREAVLLMPDNRTKLNVLRSNIAGAEPDPSAQKDDGKNDKKSDKKSKEDEG